MAEYPKTASPPRIWASQVGVTDDPDLFDLLFTTLSVTTEGVRTAVYSYPGQTVAQVTDDMTAAINSATAALTAAGFAIVGATI
jgi:hypothetical protein